MAYLEILAYIGIGIAGLVILLVLYKALEIAYMRHRQRQIGEKAAGGMFFAHLRDSRVDCGSNYYYEPTAPSTEVTNPLAASVDSERVYEEVKDLPPLPFRGSVYNQLSVPQQV